MQQMNFFKNGMLIHSFGQCAFELGPSTPVERKLAVGHNCNKSYKRGIEPPVFEYMNSFPKTYFDASFIAFSSHSGNSGVRNPAPPASFSTLIIAL